MERLDRFFISCSILSIDSCISRRRLCSSEITSEFSLLAREGGSSISRSRIWSHVEYRSGSLVTFGRYKLCEIRRRMSFRRVWGALLKLLRARGAQNLPRWPSLPVIASNTSAPPIVLIEIMPAFWSTYNPQEWRPLDVAPEARRIPRTPLGTPLQRCKLRLPEYLLAMVRGNSPSPAWWPRRKRSRIYILENVDKLVQEGTSYFKFLRSHRRIAPQVTNPCFGCNATSRADRSGVLNRLHRVASV